MKKQKNVGMPEEPLLQSSEKENKNIFLGRVFWFLGALACLIAFLFWALSKNKPETAAAGTATQAEDSPDALIEKFHLISTVQGKRRWELFSDTARVFQASKQAFADQIYAQYYKNDHIISTLTADKAIINTDTNATQAQGHVELITENGSKLMTDTLNWDPATDQIKTDDRVRVYKGMDDITATGMVADTQLNNIRFIRDVQTSVKDSHEVVDFEKSKKF